MLVDDGLMMVSRGKSLESAHVRVDNPVNVRPTFRDCLPSRADGHGSVVPATPFELPRGVDQRRRHCVVMSAAGHGRTILRDLDSLHIGIKPNSRLAGIRSVWLSLGENGLAGLTRPRARAVPGRSVEVESRQAPMETHVPVSSNISTVLGSRLGRRK